VEKEMLSDDLDIVRSDLKRQVTMREDECRDLMNELFRVQDERDKLGAELMERDATARSIGLELESLGDELNDSFTLSTYAINEKEEDISRAAATIQQSVQEIANLKVCILCSGC
jgi:predicted RNase H-like nuclease (RuvC/YqgF family)